MDPQIVWQCPVPWMLDLNLSDWAAWAGAAGSFAAGGVAVWIALRNERRDQERERRRSDSERTERESLRAIHRHRQAAVLARVMSETLKEIEATIEALQPSGKVCAPTSAALDKLGMPSITAISSASDEPHAFDDRTAHELLLLKAFGWELRDKVQINAEPPARGTQGLHWADISPIDKEELEHQKETCVHLLVTMRKEVHEWNSKSRGVGR